MNILHGNMMLKKTNPKTLQSQVKDLFGKEFQQHYAESISQS